MKLTKDYFEARREAIAWLNVPQQKRKYAEGLVILAKSGYKKQVQRMLVQKGERDWTREKLAVCMRELVQVYYNPNDARFTEGVDVDVANDNEAKAQPPLTEKKAAELMRTEADQMEKSQEDAKSEKHVPKVIQLLTQNFGKAYNQRAKLVRQRAELGESNDQKVITQRKDLSDEIDQLSGYMDKLYKMREDYYQNGALPKEEDISPDPSPADKEDEKDVEEDLTDKTGQELVSRRKTIVDMIRRKKNFLLYQADTRQESENPLPECPKRLKIEKQIEKLEAEKTRIEYEVARRL